MGAAAQAAPRPLGSAAEAERLINHMIDVMDALLGTVEEETELVRAGALAAAARLEPSKHELSQLYLADAARLKANQDFLAQSMPEVLEALRKRHELFHALLQMNLTVLATAHAVSESIMRGVSNELARKATPQGYGASGRSVAPSPASLQPLTVSRVLQACALQRHGKVTFRSRGIGAGEQEHGKLLALAEPEQSTEGHARTHIYSENKSLNVS